MNHFVYVAFKREIEMIFLKLFDSATVLTNFNSIRFEG